MFGAELKDDAAATHVEDAGATDGTGAANASDDGEFARLIQVANQMDPLCAAADKTKEDLIALSELYGSAEAEFETVETRYSQLRAAVGRQTRGILDLAKEIALKQKDATPSVVRGKFGAGPLMIAATQKGHRTIATLEHAVKVVATKQEIHTYRALKQIHPGKQLTKSQVEQLKQDVKEHGSTAVLARAMNAKASETRRVAHHTIVEANEVRAPPPLALPLALLPPLSAHAPRVARVRATTPCVPPPHSRARRALPPPRLQSLSPPCRLRKTAWKRCGPSRGRSWS